MTELNDRDGEIEAIASAYVHGMMWQRDRGDEKGMDVLWRSYWALEGQKFAERKES